MKKLFATLAVSAALIFCSAPAQAQEININIQPAWGPTGFDYAEFYYIPEINVYYDVINSLFYYYSSGRWIGAPYLPVKYRRYDLYNMYKVVLNGHPQPWLDNRDHRRAYRHLRDDRTQIPIRHDPAPHYDIPRVNHHPWVQNPPNPKAPVIRHEVAPVHHESNVRHETNVRREEPVRHETNVRHEEPERHESNLRGEGGVRREEPIRH